MKVRTYGLFLMGLAGIVPLSVYGFLAIQESQDAAFRQVCKGSENVTEAIVDRVQGYSEVELEVLATIGAGTLQANEPEQALQAFQLGLRYSDFKYPAIYKLDPAGRPGLVVGEARPGHGEKYQKLAIQVFESKHQRHSDIEYTTLEGKGDAYAVTMGTPVKIAGTIEAVIVATYDTMGMWAPVNSEGIGETGYAAILTSEGRLVAHGDPDRRRGIFSPEDPESSKRYRSYVERFRDKDDKPCEEIGDQVVSLAAGRFFKGSEDPDGSGAEWYIIVEQSTGEAFAEARSLTNNLIVVGIVVLVLVVVSSLLGGRVLVRALENLRTHAKALTGNLRATIQPSSQILEVNAVAKSLEEMATALLVQREEARARERITTFAGVAAGLAHDLRLPVEAVLSACETIVMNPDDEEARDLLRKVTKRDLPRLKRYIDDLRRLARDGALELEYDNVDVDSLAQDICNEMSSRPRWDGVELTCRGQIGTATIDQNLVYRAVINLAQNAAEACLEKGRGNKVEIGLSDSANKDFFEIRVIDSGSGISPEHLETLKDGDFHSSKRLTGVGLGLGVARRIAAAHGGELNMSSKVGKGSTFTLCLPRQKSHQSLPA